MHTFFKVSFIGVIALFIVLIAGTSFLYVRGIHNENVTKELLSAELSHLPVPETCTELKRTYQNGGVDTRSAWFADYSCDTTAGTAYKYIANTLQSRGYSVDDASGYAAPHHTAFTNKTFYIDYQLIRSLDKNNDQQPYTTDSSVRQLSVHIYRAYTR